MNYRYRIYPNSTQEQSLIAWMDICRVAYNYKLREIKDVAIVGNVWLTDARLGMNTSWLPILLFQVL